MIFTKISHYVRDDSKLSFELALQNNADELKNRMQRHLNTLVVVIPIRPLAERDLIYFWDCF